MDTLTNDINLILVKIHLTGVRSVCTMSFIYFYIFFFVTLVGRLWIKNAVFHALLIQENLDANFTCQ